jgi:hypothetical protein
VKTNPTKSAVRLKMIANESAEIWIDTGSHHRRLATLVPREPGEAAYIGPGLTVKTCDPVFVLWLKTRPLVDTLVQGHKLAKDFLAYLRSMKDHLDRVQ